jgi:hypothetical protein
MNEETNPNWPLYMKEAPQPIAPAPENLRPNLVGELKKWYAGQDKPTRDGTFAVLVETGQADIETEVKRPKNLISINAGNGANVFSELAKFEGAKTPEQNPIPDFNKFSREGFKPVETARPVVETPPPVSVEEPKIEIPVVPLEEKIISDESVLKRDVEEGDLRIELVKRIIESN